MCYIKMNALGTRLCFLVLLSSGTVRSSITINQNPTSWWEAARGCEEAGSKLFVPESEDDYDMLLSRIDDGEFHWIGGFSFISWKWTCDSSPFYKSVCESEINYDNKQTKIGNSAFKCHKECGSKFGLQGDTCYCLRSTTYNCTDNSTSVHVVRCTGNLDDYCGSENLMSVYDVEIAFERITPSSQRCVSAKKVKGKSSFTVGDCLRVRSMAGYKGNNPRCEGKVEVKNELKDWYQWKDEHELLKITTGNIEDLTKKMLDFGSLDIRTYWIGLRGFFDSRWLFESEMPLPRLKENGFDELCLAVGKHPSDSTVIRNWTLCGSNYPSVCRKDNSTTTTPTVSTTRSSVETSTFSTTNLSSSTVVQSTFTSGNTETSTVKPSGTQDVTLTVASPRTTSELSTHAKIEPEFSLHEGSYTGLYVGIPIGLLMLIAVTVGLMLYRRRRVCFSKRKDDTTGKPETVSAFKSPTATAKTSYFSLDDNFTNTQDSMYENIQSVERNELQPFSTYSLGNIEGSGAGSNGAYYEDVGGLHDPSKDHKVKATPKVNLVKVEGNNVKVTTEGHKVKETAGLFKVNHKTEQHMPDKTTVFIQNTEYELAFDSADRHLNESEDTYNHIDKEKGNDMFRSQTPLAKAYDHVNSQGRRIVIKSGSANQSLNESEDTYDHANVRQGKAAALDTNYSNIQLSDEDCENAHGDINSTYDHTNIRQGNTDTSKRTYDLADGNDETVYDHTNTYHADKVNRGRNYDHITVGNSDDGDYDVTGVAGRPFYDETYSHVTDTDQIYSLASV